MALVQPPLVFMADERMASAWVLGMPAFYVYLGVVYFLMIGVLIWAARKGL